MFDRFGRPHPVSGFCMSCLRLFCLCYEWLVYVGGDDMLKQSGHGFKAGNFFITG